MRAKRARRRLQADLIHAQATASSADALIARLRLEIEKLRRTLYGVRSERKERLLDQLEMQLEDAEADATEDELAAERSAPSTLVKSFERKRPARKPFPEHLPRERVVIAAPQSCPCCGSTKLSKLGEDVTETLEVVPRQWKVIQTVRERFSCRQCEAITQPPAPFHVTPRGFAGPSLLAMILFEKFGQHQPLNRQSERYAREGVELSLSTLADQVGACAAALRPLHALIEAPCPGGRAAARRRHHGADPCQRPDGNRAGLGVCPRRPAIRRQGSSGGAVLRLARSNAGASRAASQRPMPAFCKPTRSTATTASIFPIANRARSSRRCAGAMRDASSSSWPTSPPMRGAARMRRRSRRSLWRPSNASTRSLTSSARSTDLTARGAAARAARESAALVAALEDWMRAERAKLSRHAAVAKAIDYMLTRWGAFTRFLARRPHLPHQQRRRARAARPGPGQEVVAVCWFRARGGTGGPDVHAHPDRKAQQRRSASLARRRSRPHRRHAADEARRATAVELAPPSPCAKRPHSRGLRRRVTN